METKKCKIHCEYQGCALSHVAQPRQLPIISLTPSPPTSLAQFYPGLEIRGPGSMQPDVHKEKRTFEHVIRMLASNNAPLPKTRCTSSRQDPSRIKAFSLMLPPLTWTHSRDSSSSAIQALPETEVTTEAGNSEVGKRGAAKCFPNC